MLLTRTKTGSPLVTAEEAADFLKVSDTSEHPFIAALVEGATRHCEAYTGRDVRPNEYELLRDGFSDVADGSIELNASLVGSITSIAYLVSTAWTTVSTTVYYLEPKLSCALANLVWNQVWPTNADTQNQNVRVRFVTKAHKDVDLCRAGILRHVALMYADRGDMAAAKVAVDSDGARTLSVSTAKQSGAEVLYAPIALVGF